MSVGKKRSGDVRIGTPAAPWFVSYSDLMTQLLIFFVMLFALSGAATEDQLKKIKNKIDNYVTENKLETFVSTQITQKEGLIISFSEKYMFDSGHADIYPEAKTIITDIVGLLAEYPNRVSIEGHTDNAPIATAQFPSNWELSTARATNVLRLIIYNITIGPERFTSAGYGEYHPAQELIKAELEVIQKERIGNLPKGKEELKLSDLSKEELKILVSNCNSTPEKKAKNRRIDVVVRRLDLDEMRQWNKKLAEATRKVIGKK
ncbi:MAG: hypothetical protein AUJ85_04190 [Elusimicrobia bacterium CG1_02_37_114]|nr:MAG: hypothetical protein AUJ85_04190 [Elusimicrobia bacterium CG1_02_37_114]PIV52265.1 MAG: hypothetical protein COS17_10065 [Elusimicrobia bacterium CG02_land_8_20_14_3_00_37_13]PIZ12920.1 MAG: hypothetical protein COY53_07515 [Elusimicrobia bacterium CG_4_10_14_0_8_um_filter_37_32]